MGRADPQRQGVNQLHPEGKPVYGNLQIGPNSQYGTDQHKRPQATADNPQPNSMRQRMSRDTRHVCAQMLVELLGVHRHAPLIRLAIALRPRCTEILTSDSPMPAAAAASAILLPSRRVSL